ncbi:urease accessory protein UreD [Sinomonas sp. ASV322]|uniref:urease accessory protein UreD n=1 Tax=Sinomonas sp. ASV322 TaxID=3041920 RepID=UPI0027DE25F8|nr:urease accessory protein UreD [Sinomonas sp. ASV322]MDQ4503085.1 urease accessory protein UreD [Sinomonas sp. ASV322]
MPSPLAGAHPSDLTAQPGRPAEQPGRPDAQPGEPTTAAPPLTGELRLRIARRGGRSTAVEQFHVGSLRVLRAYYAPPARPYAPPARPNEDATGQPIFTVVNPGGGYLGGDAYATEIMVEEGASALLTTQSATKVYRTPQGPALATQRFELGPRSRLESVPDSLIAYRDASYRQDTLVDMAPDASLALAEVVTHGWSPDGEPFRFDEVSLVTRVRVGGRLAVADNLLIRPGEGGAGPLMLGGRTHVGSLLVVDPRADDGAVVALRALLAARCPSPPAGPLVGVTRLAVPGFALRALADSTQGAEAVLRSALDWMRAEWHGLPPIDLRKL